MSEETLGLDSHAFQVLFQHTSDCVTLVDLRTGRYLNANPAAEALFGLPVSAITKLTVRDVCGEAGVEFRNNLFRGRSAADMGELAYDMPGGPRFAKLRAFRLDKHTALGIALDVTEQRASEESLRRSDEQFRASMESLMDCIAIYTPVRDSSGRIVDLRIEFVNQAASVNISIPRHYLVGKGMLKLFPGSLTNGLFDQYCRVMDTGVPFHAAEVDYRDSWKGRAYHSVLDISASRAGDGLVVAWRDVSQRVQAKETLERQNRQLVAFGPVAGALAGTIDLVKLLKLGLSSLLEATRLQVGAVYLLDERRLRLQLAASLGVSRALARALKSVAVSPEGLEAHSKAAEEGVLMVPTGSFAASRETYGRIAAEVKADGLDIQDIRLLPLAAHGQLLGLLAIVTPVRLHEDDKLLLTTIGHQLALAIHNALQYRDAQREVAARKRAEERLKESQSRLRTLAHHQNAALEEERKKIAREIHDDLGQCLIATRMELSALAALVKGHGGAEAAEKLQSLSRLIADSSARVKGLALQLRPALLDDLGLAAAIQWQGSEFQKHSGISCETTLEPDDLVLEGRLSTAVFRIVQEALSNVARHSGADKVEVSLRRSGAGLDLMVRDNGSGIRPQKVKGLASLGIVGMTERALEMGGKLRITGSPGRGTVVAAHIPLPARGHHD